MNTVATHQGFPVDGWKWRELFVELYRRSQILAITGWIHVILLAGILATLPFDSRLVMGINPWIKPIKFAISIIIYVWTVGWLLKSLSVSSRARGIIGWGISVAMLSEIVCIVIQAARGTTSHYNVQTPLDAAIFGVMGTMIALNTILVFWLLIFFFMEKRDLPSPYLWGIRAGLIIFLAASAIGGVMISHGAHSVGVKDGGPGLPVVNWSTEGGDLRLPHFLGLHALQLLPMIGFLIGRQTRWTTGQKVASMLAVSGAYAVFTGAMYWQAIHGLPLLRANKSAEPVNDRLAGCHPPAQFNDCTRVSTIS